MQAELRALFFDRVQTFATSESLRVAFPNTDFDATSVPSSELHFLEAFVLPVEPEVFGVCGQSRNRFILQVSIHSREGIGEVKAQALIDKLRTHEFTINSTLDGASYSFKVIRPASARTPDKRPGWFVVPARMTVESIH